MRNAQPALLLVLCAVFAAACSSPTRPTSQPPQLTAVTPASGDRGATLTVTVTGSNFGSSAATTLTLSGTGIIVGNVAIPDATTATASLTIAPDAPLGPRILTITTAAGTSSSINFTVTAAVPTLSSISPSSAPSGGVVVATLTGSGFVSDATVAVSGAGVNISDVNVASSTSMTARFAVDAAADLSARSVTVTTSGGTTSGQTFTVAAPAPAFTSISPSFGARGNTVTVTLSGTGLVAGATSVAVSGGGITVQNIGGPLVAATGRTMTADLVIDANAATGPRSVTITTPGGTSSTTFDVRAQLPTLASFRASPPVILQGGSTRLEWTGVTNATTCGINNDVGAVSCADGGVVVSPRATVEYQLMVIGPGGREWMYVTVNVESAPAGPPATPPPPVVIVPSGSQVFNFTGAAQTFVVPAGVTRITVEAFGGQGAPGSGIGLGVGGAGGRGGRIQATIAVVPGATYQVNVGGQGATLATHPGGGGGGSDIRTGGTALANRVVVAGGGGGGAGANNAAGVVGGAGGAGGGLTSGTGGNATHGGIGGNGGTQVAGGTPGGGLNVGQPGTLGQGGAGCCALIGGAGGFNGGGQAGPAYTGGPGGGGFYGGGGGSESGNATAGGGGGGGSSFSNGTNVTHTQGVRSGNGMVTITW